MAGKVFFSVSMSLDGFIAPESLGDLMGQQWMELQQWIFPQRFFRENLKLGEGGEEGRDNDIARETFERTGASVMGKRMFDAGEQAWPEEAPFHTPVFVVTHEKRDPWERPGGTTFHFVNDGLGPALDQAREAPGDPNAFESVLTFEPDGAATRIEMHTVFPTKELRDEAVEKYHAIEGGQQTLGNLAAYVTEIVRKGGEG